MKVTVPDPEHGPMFRTAHPKTLGNTPRPAQAPMTRWAGLIRRQPPRVAPARATEPEPDAGAAVTRTRAAPHRAHGEGLLATLGGG